MGDYIDREAAIRYIEEKKHEFGITNCNACNFKDILRAQPPADVRPVVRGRWKYFRKQNKAVCTVCSFERDLDQNFGKAIACPNCGAGMKEDDEI